jgi:hypothetical protein
LGAILLAGLALSSGKAQASCPNIANAIAALKKAQMELQTTKQDFGGNKAPALKDVESALLSLRKCLENVQCK